MAGASHPKRTGDIAWIVAAILYDAFKERRDRFLGFEIVRGIVGFEILHANGNITLPLFMAFFISDHITD